MNEIENKKTFEEKLARLEVIATEIESSKKPLQELIKLFKEGMLLSKECKNELSGMDAEVRKVIEENSDGSLETEKIDFGL